MITREYQRGGAILVIARNDRDVIARDVIARDDRDVIARDHQRGGAILVIARIDRDDRP